VSLTTVNVATALGWAAAGAGAAWLVTWPVRRRSITWLMFSVAITGTAASVGALLGALHTMLLMGDSIALVVLALLAGAIALTGAAAAARRISREHRAVVDGLAEIAGGRTPVLPVGAAANGLQRQLHQTARALTESRERERALESSRRELVAWMSHDLRTPLAGLRAMAEALEDDLVPEPAFYYKQIGAAVDRLNGMVDDLFALAQVQAGAFGRHAEPIGLEDLVSDCLAALQPLADSKRVSLVGQVENGATVHGSVAELNRAVTNVIANAIRHTPEDGTVEVTLGVQGGTAHLSVKDECGGIPGDVLSRVFDVGYRAGAARDSAPGSGGAGLGLAITRGILEAHSGSVQVENIDGGCRFRLRLPAA